jgi:hypothetical protein
VPVVDKLVRELYGLIDGAVLIEDIVVFLVLGFEAMRISLASSRLGSSISIR